MKIIAAMTGTNISNDGIIIFADSKIEADILKEETRLNTLI